MRLALSIFALCAAAFAQDTRGKIHGTITDSQAAAVSGATVTITNTGTGTNTRLATNDAGYYEAPLLLPGGYSVTVNNNYHYHNA